MPIPKPAKNESKDKFIARCMGAIKEEYPDQKQRYAICVSNWDQKGKK